MLLNKYNNNKYIPSIIKITRIVTYLPAFDEEFCL